MSLSELSFSAFRFLKRDTRRFGGSLIRRSLSVSHRARALLRRLGVALAARKSPPVRPKLPSRQVERAGIARVPSHRCFRVLFIVRPGITEAACMRYRAYNVMEALRKVGVETDLLDDQLLEERLGEVLGFDLIVLVRRRSTPEIASLLEFAERHSLPAPPHPPG